MPGIEKQRHYLIAPNKQREYYLKWRSTHLEKSLANSKKSRKKHYEWHKIKKVFLSILIDQ
jgi:hypothetical protein